MPGYTFNLLGASASHALYGDPFVKVLVPIIILGFVLASYRQLEDWLGVSKGE